MRALTPQSVGVPLISMKDLGRVRGPKASASGPERAVAKRDESEEWYMRGGFSQGARGRLGGWTVFPALALAVLTLAAATPAQSFAVYFDGPDGFGVGEANAEAAAAAGVPLIPATNLLPIDELVGSVAKDLDVASVVNPAAPSRANPVSASSQWSVGFTEAASEVEGIGENAWLLLTTPLESPPFPDANVGLDLDPALGWALIVAEAGESIYYYPAVDIRPVPLGGSRDFTVSYRVAQSLPEVDGILTFPNFQGGVAFSLVAIPEPTTLLLLAAGLGGLLVAGYRPCR